MNYKTTLILFLALVGLGGLYVLKRANPVAPVTAEKSPPKSDSVTTRTLLDPKPGDPVKVVVKRRGESDWIFEKDSSTDPAKSTWRMTAPLQTPVAGHEVDRIGRQLTGLTYDISYQPGDSGAVTASRAGLEPPELTIQLSDAAGAMTGFAIGRPASDSETYVRLEGKDTIVVAKSNLKNLVKAKALEYRDLQLWNFPAEKVTRVEIIDRGANVEPRKYVFSKDGQKWMLESPVSAKATGKIDEMLRSINRLRAQKWEDDRRERLATFDLDPASLSVNVTVEEEVPAEPKKVVEGEPAEPTEPEPPTKKTTYYQLHLSTRSPIGGDDKVYIRTGEEAVVGTILKTVADKCRPVMAEWRDMHVAGGNVGEATRIELTLPDGKAALVKDLGRWKFDAQGGPAEDAAVKALLKALGDLTALSYTEGEAVDPAVMGFQQPQAEIRLTVPGLEQTERIVVGGFADTASKRTVYVRRNESAAVAKVRVADVAPLLQSTKAYRDRTIVDIHPSRFEKLVLTTNSVHAPTPTPQSLTLQKSGDEWTLTAPGAAALRKDRIDQFVAGLGSLRADAIVADEGSLSAFGLHQPAVTLRWTHKPPVEYRVDTEKKPEAAEGQPKDQPAQPVEFQPPSQSLELLMAEHDGKYFAKRSDRPAIYQVSADFYQQALAEFRSPEVLSFDDAKVRSFSIRVQGTTAKFEKRDAKWIYAAEPDLPLDAVKVQNLMLQLKDLKTERFAGTSNSDPAQWGLAEPAREVSVQLEDGTEHVLYVSGKSSSGGADKGFYAQVKGREDVFLLTADTLDRFNVNLAELEKK